MYQYLYSCFRIAPISPCSTNGSRHHYFPIVHHIDHPCLVHVILTMASHPKLKKLLLAPIFLEDSTKSAPIHIEHSHYSPLNGSNWLGTTLIDYLIQRFITPSCIEENTVIPSLEFMDQMAIQMKKLNLNKRGHKASVKKTRMNFMFFHLVNLELLLQPL
jgi:hypothetical protein